MLGRASSSAKNSCRALALTLYFSPQRVSPAQNVEDARNFAEANGMSEYADLFGRAALVAREPIENFEAVEGLPEEEHAALSYEKDHKWHGPVMLWYSISLCAIGAVSHRMTGISRSCADDRF